MKHINRNRPIITRALALGLGVFLTLNFSSLSHIDSSSLYAASFHEQQDDLRKLQKRIANLQKQIRKDTRKRDESQSLLETIDQNIAGTQKQLLDDKNKLEQSKLRIQGLEKEQEQALNSMGKQQRQLAAILKLAHQNQQIPALKLFLNESDPAKVGRQMVYYRHMMKAQEAQASELTKQVRGYVDLLDKASQEQTNLEALQIQHTESLENLKQSRVQRTTLVTQLAANIKSQAQEVETLSAEEKSLNQVISELARSLESFPDTKLQSFSKLRGQLQWPVQGRLLHNFGEKRVRGQQVRWRGVFVAAERNTEVRAVAYGRVVYADWLPGHGLITIMDHGDNYLSLYANAEMLFKEVGVWVQAGEVIASVGDSGGNQRTGLYFEIRRAKKAQNPVSWFKASTP